MERKKIINDKKRRKEGTNQGIASRTFALSFLKMPSRRLPEEINVNTQTATKIKRRIKIKIMPVSIFEYSSIKI